MNAKEARQLAQNYEPPVTNLDTVMPVVMEKIEEAAKKGLFEVTLQNIPMAYEVKKALKEKGFDVSVFRSYDDYYKQTLPTGEIKVSWKFE